MLKFRTLSHRIKAHNMEEITVSAMRNRTYLPEKKGFNYMCGIIGYSGTENAVPKLLDGLSALEYRGYDSAGIALCDNGTLTVVKAKGRIENLKERIKQIKDLYSNCGIGHTRWATHGKPSDVNSHPHGTSDVQIVHNGIIENHEELKTFLEEKGYTFVSETDTEVAAKLIDYYYHQNKTELLKALISARKLIKGSYAIAVLFAERPGEIYGMRKDNPILAAKSADGFLLASDIPAFLRYTDTYYRIDEDEICVITDKKVSFYTESGKERFKNAEKTVLKAENAEKGGYAHYMIKEIHEENEALIRTLRPKIKDEDIDFGIDSLTESKLRFVERIHIAACGTAMHAGLLGKYAVEKLARIPVNVEIASEFRYKNPVFCKNDLVIVISQSGETADTLASLRLAKKQGIYTLAVVNVPDSTIAREADGVIYTYAGVEIAVASTKAYTVQTAVMYLFALKLAQIHSQITQESFTAYLHELINVTPERIKDVLQKNHQCAEIAKKYKDSKSIFFIGRGADYYLAMEAALKLKEISYIHCEAYAAGELKHGTISLVTEGTPVFAILTSDDISDKMMNNIKEVKARGADVLLICREDMLISDGIADSIIRLPEMSDIFMPIPCATIAQLIAYYTALYLGYDVDKPRNLAKSVTVE